jgi:succinate dehydrogenase (or fumarate reductase) cytochrome b subunit, b558 family
MWLLNSSIGRKVIMSVSGLFLVLFLLFHMCMNMTLLFSTDAYDWICEMLGANWYAVAATLVLAAGVAVHFIFATILTLQNMKARGAEKYAFGNGTKTEWAAKNMYVLGIIVVLGLLVHLKDFWYEMQFKELFHLEGAVTHGSGLVINLFQSVTYVIIYLVWLAAIWFHLTHGIWSAMQTLGWNGKTWYPRVKVISNVISTIIMLGFAAVPVFFFLQSFCEGTTRLF